MTYKEFVELISDIPFDEMKEGDAIDFDPSEISFLQLRRISFMVSDLLNIQLVVNPVEGGKIRVYKKRKMTTAEFSRQISEMIHEYK